MAASVSGIPLLLYYTSGNEKLTKVKHVRFLVFVSNSKKILNVSAGYGL